MGALGSGGEDQRGRRAGGEQADKGWRGTDRQTERKTDRGGGTGEEEGLEGREGLGAVGEGWTDGRDGRDSRGGERDGGEGETQDCLGRSSQQLLGRERLETPGEVRASCF